MPEKILIPLDGTDEAEQTVPFIGEVAKAGGFDVTLLSIIDPEDLDVTETAGEGVLSARDTGTAGSGAGMDVSRTGTGGTTGMVWMSEVGSPADLSKEEAEALDLANQTTRDYLHGVESKLEALGVTTDVRLGFGNADREIVEEAKREGCRG